MNKGNKVILGSAIFNNIHEDPYLNELYENILYNYSIKLFKAENIKNKDLNIIDALRFADILSKSTDPVNADKHKILAQEIAALLNTLVPENAAVKFYLGSVLLSTGNYRGIQIVAPDYQSETLLEKFFIEFSKDIMRIPAEPEKQFFHTQKLVYDKLDDPFLSYSGPTSMGKSFVMRMFIKHKIMNGFGKNFALVVPTKALINEVSSKLINDLKELLSEHNYRLVTSAGALALEEDHNFIFVLTPERLLYLLISNPEIYIDYLFIDEAHKISSKDSRSAFYYKIVDMLSLKKPIPKIIFASPNIPNPELYIKLIPNIDDNNLKNKVTSSFSPVSQIKFLIDLVESNIQIYNSYQKSFIQFSNVSRNTSLCEIINHIGRDSQNIVYCSSTRQAINLALNYSQDIENQSIEELQVLSRDIKNEVHGDYYLAEIITKGVAYHIGYLPSAIRMRMENLFRQGLIKTMFCTSTLVEGVNLPADNLFITSYKIGQANLTPVDFKNLVGRVGRIEYNLYGHVFLVRIEDKIKKQNFEKLLKTEVPNQRLSLTSALSGPQKKAIVNTLLKGDIELLKLDNQSADSYSLMRKFANMLLHDIIEDKISIIIKEFNPFFKNGDIQKIKNLYTKYETITDNDINITIDQAKNLSNAIAEGLEYPTLRGDNTDYQVLLDFLEILCDLFKWELYEPTTLGYLNKEGSHSMLRWYAVILLQWMKGSGLSYIISQAIKYKRDTYGSTIKVNGKYIIYDDSLEHRNIVISDTLYVIDNVILFSISNYFLRFSSEFKNFHKVDAITNDWYEYVEYGTSNHLTIMLQRSGFSRETATFIKQHRSEYVVILPTKEIKLKRSILNCNNIGVRNETNDIQYNIPDLFID